VWEKKLMENETKMTGNDAELTGNETELTEIGVHRCRIDAESMFVAGSMQDRPQDWPK
jgi:hypothetical protein